MFINPKLKLEKLTDTGVRAYLSAAHLDVDKKRLSVTNGNILAVIPVDLSEGDTSGPVTTEVIKAARATRSERVEITCNGGLGVDGKTFERPDLGKFPDIDRVIPDGEPEFSVGLNARLLFELAEALTVSNKANPPIVKLDFYDLTGKGAIRVTAGKNPDAIGVLMPCRL